MVKQAAERILVPVDFTHNSMAALHVAITQSCKTEAQILLLGVIGISSRQIGGEATPSGSPNDGRAKEARERLDVLCQILRTIGIRVIPLLAYGSPAEEILKAAEQEHADLIIMPSQWGEDLSEEETSRLVETVLRNAPCEAWSLRGREQAKSPIHRPIGQAYPVGVAG